MNNSIKQCSSWEINSAFASRKIFLTLWEQTFRDRIHNSRPLVPILSQTYPVHALTNPTRKSDDLYWG
jgi:hypothetical protein